MSLRFAQSSRRPKIQALAEVTVAAALEIRIPVRHLDLPPPLLPVLIAHRLTKTRVTREIIRPNQVEVLLPKIPVGHTIVNPNHANRLRPRIQADLAIGRQSQDNRLLHATPVGHLIARPSQERLLHFKIRAGHAIVCLSQDKRLRQPTCKTVDWVVAAAPVTVQAQAPARVHLEIEAIAVRAQVRHETMARPQETPVLRETTAAETRASAVTKRSEGITEVKVDPIPSRARDDSTIRYREAAPYRTEATTTLMRVQAAEVHSSPLKRLESLSQFHWQIGLAERILLATLTT